MSEKEKVAAITALILHINKGNDKFNKGREKKKVWALEHRRKIMGVRGLREMKNSRTTWR